MNEKHPSFPPLLSGHLVDGGFDLALKAKSGIRKGKWRAGDLLWTGEEKTLEFALVMEPEIARNRCGEMTYVSMVAVGDALGALCPAEVSIQFQWPNHLIVNGADAGFIDLLVSKDEVDGVPNWMVLSCMVRLAPDNLEIEPGDDISLTNLWDEGCGELSKTELLESCAKHLINWIHHWQEDGFKVIYEQWWGRRFGTVGIVPGLLEVEFELTGMDESGNGMVLQNDKVKLLDTLEMINELRDRMNP